MRASSCNSPPEKRTTKSVRFHRETIEADFAKKEQEEQQKDLTESSSKPSTSPKKMAAKKKQSDRRKGGGGVSAKNDVSEKGGNDPNKPKRPLSAYNMFFRHERERILATSGVRLPSRSSQTDGMYGKSATGARLHRKTHGLISFKDLARAVAARWKSADAETRRHFDELAADEKRRYKTEMERFKQIQEDGGVTGINQQQQFQWHANDYHYAEGNNMRSEVEEHAASSLVNLAHPYLQQQPQSHSYSSTTAHLPPPPLAYRPPTHENAGSGSNGSTSSSSYSSSVWAPLDWRSGGYQALPSVPLHSELHHPLHPPAPAPAPASHCSTLPPRLGCHAETAALGAELTNTRPQERRREREHFSPSSFADVVGNTTKVTGDGETGENTPSPTISTSSYIELLKSANEVGAEADKCRSSSPKSQQRGKKGGGECGNSGESSDGSPSMQKDGGGIDIEPLPYWRMGQLETLLQAQATITSPKRNEGTLSGDDDIPTEEERPPSY